MVDVLGLASAALTADDFAFKVGNGNNPSAWAVPAARPVVAVRRGAGLMGSDRVAELFGRTAQ